MLIIIGMFMLGMGIDVIGELHLGIFLGAVVFMVGLPLLSGLGIRLGLGILTLLPRRFNWIYFAAVFFVFSFFHVPTKAQVIISLFLLCSGAFLGAGIYNLMGDRWLVLSRARQILTLSFLLIGAGLFAFGWVYLLYQGKGQEEIKAWSMEVKILPDQLQVEDPTRSGSYQVDSLTYGWGKDRRRKEFGEGADLITPVVDGSHFLDGWEKFPGKMRTSYWKMGPDSLALNGRVWYPEGEGPFPLVLMVHGNHHDRDFSDPGYGYLGRHFASHGIISVSVDENFLNGAWYDFNKGLKTENDCRAWLLLKHLEQWREWNSSDSSVFSGKVDLEQVVLIGHSRGGEAVSIASFFNGLPYYPDNSKESFDFHFGIKGVVAIAPVDGQYWPGGLATPVRDVNYFTIQGSMDADLRSYDGLRQMRRVKFTDSVYHFASGLYVHGANHGQFNQTWGLFDAGYPTYLFLNRQAIIPVKKQEQVALAYLFAFVKESVEPGSGYLPLFKDYRYGRHWLPELVYLNQFHESSASIICEYDEDLDLTTGTAGVDHILAKDLSLWKEGRIPKKWGNYRNNGVFLGWNNKKDSIPGAYTIVLDSSYTPQLADYNYLSFFAADAQTGAGERAEADSLKSGANSKKSPGNSKKSDNEEEKSEAVESGKSDKKDKKDKKDKEKEEEEPEPLDFNIILTDKDSVEYRIGMADYQRLQPPIKPEVFKSRLFWEDPESEVILQYVTLPLEGFVSDSGRHLSASDICSITFVFDEGEKGSVILDQIGFSR
jgi:hypothetical protein